MALQVKLNDRFHCGKIIEWSKIAVVDGLPTTHAMNFAGKKKQNSLIIILSNDVERKNTKLNKNKAERFNCCGTSTNIYIFFPKLNQSILFATNKEKVFYHFFTVWRLRLSINCIFNWIILVMLSENFSFNRNTILNEMKFPFRTYSKFYIRKMNSLPKKIKTRCSYRFHEITVASISLIEVYYLFVAVSYRWLSLKSRKIAINVDWILWWFLWWRCTKIISLDRRWKALFFLVALKFNSKILSTTNRNVNRSNNDVDCGQYRNYASIGTNARWQKVLLKILVNSIEIEAKWLQKLTTVSCLGKKW